MVLSSWLLESLREFTWFTRWTQNSDRRPLDQPVPGNIRKQESLANAKVSTRQPWYIGRNSLNRPPLRIVQQYQRRIIYTSLKSTFSAQQFHRRQCGSIFIGLAVVASQTCQLAQKFRENLNLQQFKIIQGRWFWYQSKVHIQVPISH